MTDPSASSRPQYGERTDATTPAANPLAAAAGSAHPSPEPFAALPAPPASAAAGRRERRGILLALLAIPIGATLWVLVWNLGFIASIVSFATAWGAIYLYRLGSNGRTVTRKVFLALVGIILAAVIVSFLAAIGSDVVAIMGASTALEALTSGEFLPLYWYNLVDNREMWADLMPDILMSVLFAAIGCFGTIRDLFRESRSR